MFGATTQVCGGVCIGTCTEDSLLSCQRDGITIGCKCQTSPAPTADPTTTDPTTTFLAREEDNEPKCGSLKHPACSEGKCEDPDKVCVSKFNKKKNKMVCKCRKQDATDENDDDDSEE